MEILPQNDQQDKQPRRSRPSQLGILIQRDGPTDNPRPQIPPTEDVRDNPTIHPKFCLFDDIDRLAVEGAQFAIISRSDAQPCADIEKFDAVRYTIENANHEDQDYEALGQILAEHSDSRSEVPDFVDGELFLARPNIREAPVIDRP